MHEAHKLGMGVQGISGAYALSDGQGRQHLLGDWDLVGFLVHAHLPERFLAVMGRKGEQMGSGLLTGSGSPQGLAIEREWLVGFGRRGGLHPASPYTRDGAGLQRRQDPPTPRA